MRDVILYSETENTDDSDDTDDIDNTDDTDYTHDTYDTDDIDCPTRLKEGNHHFRLDFLFSLVITFLMVPGGNRVKIRHQGDRFRVSPSSLSTRE